MRFSWPSSVTFTAMELSTLLIMALLSILAVLVFYVFHFWATPKAMEVIPGSLGWPVVGESFSFLSEFSSSSGIYNFMHKRQER